MIEADRRSRNVNMLAEMYPAYRVRLQAVLTELESLGYRPRIQQAWRSIADQLDAYRRGYSQVQYGFHNVTGANGTKEALAADVLDDDQPLTAKTHFMLHLLAAAEKNGLTTGIRWGLSDDKVKAINDAIASGNWNVPIHVGWDPLHVEIAGISIAEAKQGKRPLMPGEQPPAPGNTTDTTTPPPAPETPPPPKRRFKVEEIGTSNQTEYELGNPLRPVSLLPVPYVSQLGPGASDHNNDCGAACAVMLLRAYQKSTLTPDEFYIRFGFQGDPYLSVTQLRTSMSSLGLLTDFQANLNITDIFGLLAASKPLIVLIRYKALAEAGLTEKTFQGPHFAVVVGLDPKYIYIHDPLYTDPLVGEAHAYPIDIFWKAWKDVAADPSLPNPERSAIIPASGIGFQMSRKVQVNITTLNVRNGPGLGNTLVGTLKKGEIVDVQREMSGWGEIGFNRWILLSYTLPVTSS